MKTKTWNPVCACFAGKAQQSSEATSYRRCRHAPTPRLWFCSSEKKPSAATGLRHPQRHRHAWGTPPVPSPQHGAQGKQRLGRAEPCQGHRELAVRQGNAVWGDSRGSSARAAERGAVRAHASTPGEFCCQPAVTRRALFYPIQLQRCEGSKEGGWLPNKGAAAPGQLPRHRQRPPGSSHGRD